MKLGWSPVEHVNFPVCSKSLIQTAQSAEEKKKKAGGEKKKNAFCPIAVSLSSLTDQEGPTFFFLIFPLTTGYKTQKLTLSQLAAV